MSKRKSIVTGGAGFVGSHMAERLLAEGHEVLVVDDLSSGKAENVPGKAAFEELSIVERERLNGLVDRFDPDAIFHLAAQPSVTASVADPAHDCAVNVQGTLNVVEAAKRHGAPVVFASTGGALYGNDAPVPTPEDRLPAPLAPYGASKWAGEAYLLTWSRSGGIPHAVCRLGNVYGPRQSPHGECFVVAIFSWKLWRGEVPTIFGHGRPTRDYIHVADVVEAMVRASGVFGIFNVSTGIETDVMTIFEALQRAAGTSLEPVLAPLREGELERSCMDPSRARSELGWEAEIPLEEGLQQTYRALAAEFEAGGVPS